MSFGMSKPDEYVPLNDVVVKTFALTIADLVQLIETPRDRIEDSLVALGGVEGIAKALEVDVRTGLKSDDQNDLTKREETFGKNYILPPSSKGILHLMWDAFQDITIVVLTISGAISIALSETVGDHKETDWIEGTCILLAVFLVILVTAINDYKKEQQFRALNAVKEDEKIKVWRDGKPQEVSKWKLVVGDIVRINLGDIVPADGILLEGREIRIDESTMTGESDLVCKDRENPILLSGTKLMEGFGKMLVLCVGEHSQAGMIKKLISGTATNVKDDAHQSAENEIRRIEMKSPARRVIGEGYEKRHDTHSPLEAKLYRLTILIGKAGTCIALLVFIIMSIRLSIEKFIIDHEQWDSSYISDYLRFFITAITVLVVAIPEGLPLAVTISLAYSVRKMLADNNLVRHLNACETMGSATTICSDKTGTLTTNRMTVMKVWIEDRDFTSSQTLIKAIDSTLKDTLCIGICINSTAEILPPKVEGGLPEHTGNKTECALLQFVQSCGVLYSSIRSSTEITRMLTFSSQKKRMSVVTKLSKKVSRVYTKGATEIVLDLCTSIARRDGSTIELDAEKKTLIKKTVIENYASQGYRTLCLAYRDVPTLPSQLEASADSDIETDLTCIGIVGIEDPVRSEVPEAIQVCHKAGIVVRMVTGDNISTARSIAAKCGIIESGDNSLVMEGAEFRARVLDARGRLKQAAFDGLWPKLRVLARSSPKDKYTLVTGLMETKMEPHGPQIVAVTGDGTNDAPALKKADVGFAMGISGTAVAKDASDIIIMDDNFSSIVKAIKWGRNVYDSIAKFLQFQLTVNIVAISLAFLGAILLQQSPLTAVQMLWINLIMDSFASLALATEPPTALLLDRAPYPKTQPLLSKTMTKHILGQSIFQLTVLLVLVFLGDVLFDIPSGRVYDLPEDERDDPSVHMTIVFNVFVWMQLFNELNCRKIHDELNIFDGLLHNSVFVYVCVFQIGMQVILVQVTGRFFNTEPLSIGQWFVCIGIGFLSIPIGLTLRVLSDRHLPPWMACCREVEVMPIADGHPARGQELWLRGFTRIRAQIRVIKAFQERLDPVMSMPSALYSEKKME
ncbi:unnamed protein product [Albugo candida]|uniref:Calcium-transporting ATPase n=1 Tax=Albugo candida TaxID=65357 RepID=A0A024GFZ9_9STRA|nr:unnamed protein product [Albugo candida]|eukprot:CCI45418.1 unnamed protein product [Albugo candida]